jgi:hypothetical protein
VPHGYFLDLKTALDTLVGPGHRVDDVRVWDVRRA